MCIRDSSLPPPSLPSSLSLNPLNVSHHGTSVVGSGDGSEPLLTCCVPYLELDLLPFNLNSTNLEINTCTHTHTHTHKHTHTHTHTKWLTVNSFSNHPTHVHDSFCALRQYQSTTYTSTKLSDTHFTQIEILQIQYSVVYLHHSHATCTCVRIWPIIRSTHIMWIRYQKIQCESNNR